MNVAGLDMAVDDRVVLAVNGTMTEGKTFGLSLRVMSPASGSVWLSFVFFTSGPRLTGG
jgi:hypothetical protein